MYLANLNVMGVEPVDKGHLHDLPKTKGRADGSTQTITCEWMQNVKWLPLCDRIDGKGNPPILSGVQS